MIKILMFLALLAAIVFIVGWVANYFNAANRAVRTNDKATKYALTSSNQRSMIAERALREIAAGAEYPIFVAEDSLRQINETYSKEIV